MSNSAPTPPDLEALSAYLAGDLPAGDAVALEDRLRRDPLLAAELERLHETLIALQGVDAVEPPTGFAERLSSALADDPSTGEVPEAPVPADNVRRLTPRRPRWSAIGTVAAAVLAVALVGGGITRLGVSGADRDVAMETTDDGAGDVAAGGAPAPPEPAALDEEISPATGGLERDRYSVEQNGMQPEALGGASTMSQAASRGPLIVDDTVDLPDDAAVRARYQAAPEAERLVGVDLDLAGELAAAYRVALLRVQTPFSNGTLPADCLPALTAGTDAPVVVVRAESARSGGQDALAYLVVTASEPASALDRVEAWVVDTPGCAPRFFSLLG